MSGKKRPLIWREGFPRLNSILCRVPRGAAGALEHGRGPLARGPRAMNHKPRSFASRTTDRGQGTPGYLRVLFIPYPKHYTGPMTQTSNLHFPDHPIAPHPSCSSLARSAEIGGVQANRRATQRPSEAISQRIYFVRRSRA